MKVRDVIANWPLRRWTPDDASETALRGEPEQVRLLWFSTPDTGGWFRVSAMDDAHGGWARFCRVENAAQWPALEITLSGKLRASLAEIGAIDLSDLNAAAKTR